MIACISPSAGEKNETRNTLEYANRARNIKNTVNTFYYYLVVLYSRFYVTTCSKISSVEVLK